jgi:tetratricopeptide (TPR) repeat protein
MNDLNSEIRLDEKSLANATKLYEKGMYKEALMLLDFLTPHNEQLIAKANKLKGWIFYKLAIKKENQERKLQLLEKAEENFRLAEIKIKNKESKISILSGLPLVLYQQGKKEEAKKVADEVIRLFPNTPSPWNTLGILYKWNREYDKAVDILEKVFETALLEEDMRTAGNAKQNRGDALVNLNRKEEAKKDYNKALSMYKKFEEETGRKASDHIKKVKEKIISLL